VVTDVIDRESLLTAVRNVRADAVMHQQTALGTKRKGKAVQGTNALRTTGIAHPLAAARAVDDEPTRWADYLDALAAELGGRRPWWVPTSMLRPIPYLHTIITTSMRVSNAKASRELGWAPAVPTYRQGTPLVAEVGDTAAAVRGHQ
jgi:hypothetical protein